MANMKEIVPKGEFKVKTVGPSRDWEFQGNGGTVKMTTDSIQFEGHEQYWVDVNRAQDKPAPAVGEVLTGSIEQDDQGKYAPKFAKEKAAGGWNGGGRGGQSSPGAIWSAAVATAAQVVAGYYAASDKKPKDMGEFFGKIELIAPKVNALVEKFVKANPAKEEAKPADTAASESGESAAPATTAAPAPAADVVIEDISDDELGEW